MKFEYENRIRPAKRNLKLETQDPEPVVLKGHERLAGKIDEILKLTKPTESRLAAGLNGLNGHNRTR
jgi:hypothetical protein